MTALAWGAKVSPEFRDKARSIVARLGTEPSSLMACIAFETGRTFSPKARNPGSSATGLIQFMAATARSLGTSVEALAEMTAEEQLDYVYDYLQPFTGRVAELGDLYMAILYPPAVGKPDDFVVFDEASKAYQANAGLDFDHDGAITKRECVSIVEKLLAEGLQLGNRVFETQPDVPPIPLPAAPIEDRPQPPAEQPAEQETFMPIPAIILGLLEAASAVLPVIASIRADKTQPAAAKNLAVASKVLDVVKDSVGAVNQQQAVEMVTSDPAARAKADEALKAQYFDLMKYAAEQESIAWERDQKAVGDARSFGERMLGKEGWAGIGFGALIGVLAILIIVGAGWMLWRLAELATTDQTTRGLIVGAAIAMLGQVVSYFFGSSSSSRQSGEALRNIAQQKGVGQ